MPQLSDAKWPFEHLTPLNKLLWDKIPLTCLAHFTFFSHVLIIFRQFDSRTLTKTRLPPKTTWIPRWWFYLFSIFIPIHGGNDPIWRANASTGLLQPPPGHQSARSGGRRACNWRADVQHQPALLLSDWWGGIASVELIVSGTHDTCKRHLVFFCAGVFWVKWWGMGRYI